MNRRHTILASVLVVLASSCSADQPTIVEQLGSSIFGDAPPMPEVDLTSAASGEVLYQSNCSDCHGTQLEGAPDWMTSDENGKLPPPPMDSSGHTWHHSDQLLTDIVTHGSPDKGSAMLGFGDRLSGEDIAAILAFFKTRWGPDERQFQWTVTWQELERAAP